LISKPQDNFTRQFKIFSLNEVVNSAIENLSILAEDKNMTVELTSEREVSVNGIPEIIERAINNLIHNAIKFSPSESKILLTITSDSQIAQVLIKDEGPGISENDQSRIFERFYQSDSSRNQGSGLGLSLVDWAVRIHGGNVKVKSILGKGSTFIVNIPLYKEKNA